MRILEGGLLAPFLVWMGLWLWSLVDAARYPTELWIEAGESKTLWLLAIFVFQAVATIFYLLVMRPKLRALAAEPTGG